MPDKAAQIADLETQYVAFRDLLVGLPEAAYAEGGLGDWTLSDLLAHFAGWFREMAPALHRVGRGERPAPEGVNYGDADAFNARFVTQAKAGTAALDDFDEAFHVFYAAATALDDAYYGDDPEKGRPRVGSRILTGTALGHFAEHRPALEAWLRGR